jgi:hypothetical protein
MQAASMYGDLIVGTFIKEEKNRFICRIRVSGIELDYFLRMKQTAIYVKNAA